MTEGQNRPAGENPAGLVTDVVTGLARLVQGEIELARAEVARSLRDAAAAVGKLVIAAILGITAVNVLAGAAVAGLVALGLSPVWASVVVGGILLLLAFGTLQFALSVLRPANLAPKRIFPNLRRDAETLKSMVKTSATADLRS